jgi:hypothetical protein
LNLNRAIYRLDHAGEFGQDAIASRADESAVMLFDQPVDGLAMRAQSTERRLFVLPHQAAVAAKRR